MLNNNYNIQLSYGVLFLKIPKFVYKINLIFFFTKTALFVREDVPTLSSESICHYNIRVHIAIFYEVLLLYIV